MGSRLLKPHFELGKKQVLFPDFTITLLKSHLPPNYARFQVPLSFNKLDLRDYLFHAYSLRAIHIRSSISQPPAQKNQLGQLKRGPSTKYMTIQMLSPFKWPEDPEDLEANGFDKKALTLTEEHDQRDTTLYGYDKDFKAMKEREVPEVERRKLLKQQAHRLLKGEEKWMPTWEAIGNARSAGVTARK